MLDIIKQLIFDGCYSRVFKIDKLYFRVSTIKDEMYIKERLKYTSSSENLEFIIELVSMSVRAINGKIVCPKELYNILLDGPSKLVLTLYNCYSKLIDDIKDVSEHFNKFCETKESKIRWQSFKNGYKFDGVLTHLQEMWIYYNTFIDRNEDYERDFQLAKYVVNHITHAQINPKSYLNFIKRETHESSDQILEKVACNNINKNFFDKLTKLYEDKEDKQAINLVEEYFNTEDEHDTIVKKSLIDEFKNILRIKKVHGKKSTAKPTSIIRHNVGYKQAFSVGTDSEVQKPKYFVDGINYTKIVNEPFFARITLAEKNIIFNEIINEENSEELIVNYAPPQKTEHKIEKTGKSLKDLLIEKGLNVDEAPNLTIGDLNGK